MKKPTWNQLFSQALPSSRSGLYFLNSEVATEICSNPIGFYIYTKESSYKDNRYKIGQTIKGLSRIKVQASEDESIVIVGWIPSDCAKISGYDQKVHEFLHNQNKCEWLHKLDSKSAPGKEWSRFPNNNPEEIWRDYLDDKISKVDLGLTIWQLEAMDQIFTFLGEGKKKIMAELAARFGKTLLYLSTFSAMKQRVMVVGTYYLSALSSFKKEVSKYSDFSNFSVLELKSETFQEDFQQSLNDNKKIVVLASLCGNKDDDLTVRNQNAQFIEQFSNKITVIDEADYGAHTKSCVPFVNRISNNGPVILTTGTNSARAKGDHKDIDSFFKFTYLDMHMKALTKEKIKNDITKQFKRAIKFEKTLVLVKFYRYDWSRFLPSLSDHELNFNPSFAKCSRDVKKNQGFWIGLYKSLIGESPIMDANDFALSSCLEGDDPKSVMQYVSMNNTQLKKLESIAKVCLSHLYDVYVINGDVVSGEDAEQFVKDKIRLAQKSGKHVWIIASKMCQRSFSIPDINVVLLTYDNGEIGSTVQKMSRALTAGTSEKTGHIISLSIDGNRDDKIAPMIMDAAQKVAQHEDISLPDALRKVMKTFPIFQMDEDGCPVALLPDDYAKELFSTSKGIRLALDRESIYLCDFDSEAFDILSNLDVSSSSLKQLVDFVKGKTYHPQQKTKEIEKKEKDELYSHIHKNIVNILDNVAATLIYQKQLHDRITYSTLIDILNTEKDSSAMVGVDGNQFYTLVESRLIQKGILETYVEFN